MTVHLDRRQRNLILALLCTASFASVFNNLIIAPILPDISDDFGVRVAVVGLLVTATAVVGGVAGIFAGPLIDRLGRRPVVVTGMTLLAVATILSALAPSFLFLAGARALAGLGVACLTPAVFAAVGDYFEYSERGRAMSWVISANTMAQILGAPIGAFIGGLVSWRLAFVLLAGLSVVFTGLLYWKLPPDAPRAEGSSPSMRGAVRTVLRSGTTTMAIASTFLSTGYWFLFATYMGAYYHDEFDIPKWALGGLTMVMGLGVLTGSNAGGRIADRTGKRPVILWSTAACAAFIFLETTVAFNTVGAALFLFGFATAAGARFASAQAMLTEMAPSQRGTVMALNASGQQFGIVAGSALGGLVLDLWGYAAIGPAAALLALASLATYGLFVHEDRFAPAPEPSPT